MSSVIPLHGAAIQNVLFSAKLECPLDRVDPTGRNCAGLVPGVKVVSAYDRSDLILGSIEDLKSTLTAERIVRLADHS